MLQESIERVGGTPYESRRVYTDRLRKQAIATNERVDEWFATHILVHEQALMRFLGRSWRNPDELEDIRQEIYVRIYETASREAPRSPKAFLFASARHLLIDRIRRRQIVTIEAIGGWEELANLDVLDESSPEARTSARQDLHRLAHAFDGLPRSCRDVLWFRRVADMPQREVARKLNISESAVEKALARAVELLEGMFLERGRKSTGEAKRRGTRHNDVKSGPPQTRQGARCRRRSVKLDFEGTLLEAAV